MKSQSELGRVLVVPISAIKKVGVLQRFTFNVDPYLRMILDPRIHQFVERATAEVSSDYRQIIPYVLLCAGDRVCTYRRGVEVRDIRTAGWRSIGFGGHIIPKDVTPAKGAHWYTKAARREVCEEVVVTQIVDEEIIGIVSDPSSAVGRVHLGVVHIWDVSGAQIKARESQIGDISFMTMRDLDRRLQELEPWSCSIVETVRRFAKPAFSRTPQRESSSLFETLFNLKTRFGYDKHSRISTAKR
jgi:predicted NUDIX family phosphoesterase